MDLKNGMVIKCNSKEEAKEFIKEAYKQGFKWINNVCGNGKTCWYTGFSGIYYYLESNKIKSNFMDYENESIDYSTLKEKMKTMTKSDLKNGMVVELRNGKRFLIVNDLGIGKDTYIELGGYFGYDEKLYNSKGDKTYDITKIYKTEGFTFKNLFDNERLSLIWEREETKLSNEDKQIIKKGLKKIQELCKKHPYCDGCELYKDKKCPCMFLDEFDMDKLFED